jgi:hypothetical protein
MASPIDPHRAFAVRLFLGASFSRTSRRRRVHREPQDFFYVLIKRSSLMLT